MKTKTLIAVALMSLFSAANAAEKFLTLEEAVLAQAKKWQTTGVAKSITSESGKVLYPFGQFLPVMVCAPLRTCSIELEPGEKVNNIWPGDKARWHIAEGVVGTGDKATVQIGVKPIEFGIETNLKIFTNRRAYQIKLVSSESEKYIDTIGFYYPEDLFEASVKREEKQVASEEKEKKLVGIELPGPSLDNADFDYKIEGDVNIRPLRVFNNGIKTYIMMPPIIKQMEMPVLMVLDAKGDYQQVNYRLSANGLVFEVDKLFDRAVLILGPAGDELKTTITWNRSPSRGSMPRWMRNLMN